LLAASKSAAGKPLLDYLRSAAARPIWEKYGFGLGQ
jgi:ABC-type molybdate transport system substrate-binding protein